ncbi:MAG TPA: isoprenylcysteine carboxylmethyltransferase family protein [Xanthobacteraceae bacterium]|jgi:protein-S-isoprenylcysteine O-methyltransferase Ste14|nr:isoprenylcysteine carboxylmethyltransferase family protein [Xanthobacteraceae bacterium]
MRLEPKSKGRDASETHQGVIIQPNQTFQVIWIAWVVSWIAASFWSGRTAKRVTTSETWIYRIIIFAGALLIAPWTARALGESPIWQIGDYGACALVGVMLVGLALTWWARMQLGRLWSSAITRKEEHRLVETGPYALVRHPIYTGIITALLATAATQATLLALLGAVLIAIGLWVKARTEERFLLAELGPDAYESYRSRVPMLIPFVPHR